MTKMETDSASAARDLQIFNDIINHIKRKINNVGNTFFGDEFETERKEIYELLRRSIETNESNSAVVCGPTGCGKTALVNSVLSNLSTEGIMTEETASVIRLNGLLHTDDKLALRAITQQLKLSSPTQAPSYKSFQENLAYLLDQLKDKHRGLTAKPCIIFILDEFHLFCDHKNQILLYNLFDIVQSPKAIICVVGLTYFVDIMDLLEKRVLSRFSHRVIQLSSSHCLDSRLALFKDLLTISPGDLPTIDKIYKYVWNTRTDELLEQKEVKTLLKRQMDVNNSQGAFRNLMFKLFNTITFEQPLVTLDSLREVFTMKDELVALLTRMSLLEMALMIAIKHQTVNYDREPFNFEMIYTTYLKFVKRSATSLVSERAVVLKAFQRLQELELVSPSSRAAGNALGKVPVEYQLYCLNLTVEQVAEAIQTHRDLTADVLQWASHTV